MLQPIMWCACMHAGTASSDRCFEDLVGSVAAAQCEQCSRLAACSAASHVCWRQGSSHGEQCRPHPGTHPAFPLLYLTASIAKTISWLHSIFAYLSAACLAVLDCPHRRDNPKAASSWQHSSLHVLIFLPLSPSHCRDSSRLHLQLCIVEVYSCA